MDALQDWTTQVAPVLGVDPALVAATQDDVLDMVRDVAHGVVRPAAPLTAYLVGLAAGRAGADGGDVRAAVRDALTQVDQLLARRPADGPHDVSGQGPDPSRPAAAARRPTG